MFYIKNSAIKIAIVFLLMVGLGSCKKNFLDVVPKGVAIATETSDYELLLNDGNLGLMSLDSHPLMSDELAGFAPLFAVGSGLGNVYDQNAFEYQDDIYPLTVNVSELSQLEVQLYSYNKVVNEVMGSSGGDTTQKKALRAEALAGRAWVYFMMVNYYGKPYSAATAASDPGVPIVKVADVTQTTFTRSSVQDAYDQVIADLTEAIPYLSVQVVSRYRMSRAAAEAILGKVYMYMQQFDKALPLLTSSLSHLANAGVPVGLYDFNTVFNPGGAFYPVSPLLGPNGTNLYSDNEVLYLKLYTNLYSFIFSGIPISPQTAALYTKADLRLNFFSTAPFPPIGLNYPAGMMRCYGRSDNMGVNVPDIYLLKAECESRAGDLTNAVNDLVTLRKTRMQKDSVNAANIPGNIATDKVALTKYILQERIREFATTGERWWDMRRLSVDDTYNSTVGMVHNLYDITGTIIQSFPLKPERLTFRFPLYVISANPALQQNP